MKQSFRLLSLALLLSLVLPKLSYAVGNDNPTGVTGDYNGQITTAGSYDPYTGNAKRMVADITVPGSIGAYPLQWTRVLNTRNVGGWSHSYGWAGSWVRIPHEYTPGEPNPYEGPDAVVTYPDGRRLDFYEQGGEMYLAAGGAEPADGLKDLQNGYYHLLMTDGGKVIFQAQGTGFLLNLVAREIVDPYGQTTFLHYDTAGRLDKITEPGGRYLEVFYTTTHSIDYVQANDGRGTVTQTVDYVYEPLTFSGLSRSYLTQVNYDDGTHATYTYEASNILTIKWGLVKTCQDVRYAGAMSNIEYEYVPNATQVAFGQIKAEKNFHTHQALSTVTYPAWNCGPWDNAACFQRTETRADGRTRLFQYGLGGGALTSYTDFVTPSPTPHTSHITYVAVPGNLTYQKVFKDARNHETIVEKEYVAGAIRKVTHPDPAHSSVIYEYTDNANPYYLAWRRDEREKTTYFDRDGSNRIWQTRYPDGGVERFAYNSLGQVLTHTMTSGGVETFEYDDGNNDRGLKTRSYPPATESDPGPQNHPTRYYYYGGPGGPNAPEVPDAASRPDRIDRLRRVIDPRGHSTWYDYNKRGQITQITYQGTCSTQSGYNADGTLAWTQDELSNTTTFTYDEYKRVTRVTNALSEHTDTSYDPPGEMGPLSHTTSSVYLVTSHLGHQIAYDYDANFRRVMTKQAPGIQGEEAVTTSTYDAVGNLETVKEPNGQPDGPHAGMLTTYGYDERNRQTTVTRNTPAETTTVVYDPAGNKTKETRPDTSFRTWDYDEMNRLHHAYDWRMPSDAVLVTTTYVRDYAGNPLSITDAKGAVYSFLYDALSRKRQATYPAASPSPAKTETWEYDFAGNMKKYKNPAGQYKEIEYDARNRPTHSSWIGGTVVGQDIATVYNEAGYVTSMVTNSGETTIAIGYDAANRKIWEDQTLVGHPTRRVQADFDPDGRRTRLEVVDPGLGEVFSPEMSGSGSYLVEYDYTARNQLSHIYGENQLWTVNYSYDRNGNMTARRADYNGTSSSTNCPNYDALNRPTEWEQTGPGGTYAMSHYKYDLANREVATWRWEDQDKGERFTYDPANQLTKAWYSAANVSNLNLVPQNAQRTTTYAYTPNKLNRSTMTETTDPSGAGGTVTSYTPNALNQYTTVGAATYTYNDNFNLTQAEGFSGTYDEANHLVTASHTSPSATVNFVYDGLGRCVKRSVNNVGTIFVYDGWKPIGEFDDHDYFQAWNVYGPGADEIIVRQRDGIGYTWFELDRHGNVVFLLDNEGTLIEKYTYDAFGRAKVTDRNGGNPSLWSNYLHDFLFQGREYIQELGIYDYRNRFYQPATGRFLQTDPTGFDAGDMNLFRYCNDDPVDNSDPTGLNPLPYHITHFGGTDTYNDYDGNSVTPQAGPNGGGGGGNDNDKFKGSVNGFGGEKGVRMNPAAVLKTVYENAQEDVKEEATNIQAGGTGGLLGRRYARERVTGLYAKGDRSLKVGPETGPNYRNNPHAYMPDPPAKSGFGKEDLFIGTHGHGPGSRRGFEREDRPSANGRYGPKYISGVASVLDNGRRVHILVPFGRYREFYTDDGRNVHLDD